MSIETSIYLDCNASAPLLQTVSDFVRENLHHHGNPSSQHSFGRKLKGMIENARLKIASFFGAQPQEVFFTSTATESNALALLGLPAKHYIVSAVEHSSVLDNIHNFHPKNHTIVPVDHDGLINLQALETALKTAPSPCLLSIMIANNETGALQPMETIIQLAKQYGAWVHTDAVQAAGKVPLNFHDLQVDTMAFCSHKLGSLPGVGVLIMKNNLPFSPLYTGGGHERGVRHGTENALAIAALGKAVDYLNTHNNLSSFEKKRSLRNTMEEELFKQVPDLIIPSKQVHRLPNTSCLCMPSVHNSLQMMNFDLAGIAVSTGSACSSGKVKASHVLLAMGYSEEIAKTAIRVSMTPHTTEKDMRSFANCWLKIYKQHAHKA